MNLNEVKSGGYKLFSRQSEENRKKHIDAFQYIERLAADTATPVGLWDMRDIFGSPEGANFFITDRAEINKKFFESKAKSETGEEFDIANVVKAISGPINKIYESRKQSEIDQIKRNAASHQANAVSHAQRMADSISEAWKASQKLLAITGGTPPMVDHVVEIVKAKFWKFEGVSGNEIKFSTSNDVIISFIKKTAGLDMTVNLGKFVVFLNLVEMRSLVKPCGGNIFVDGYPHPHINPQGNICWGNASQTQAKLLAEGNLKEYMMLLASLISSYGDQSPYKSINHFYDLRDAERSPAGSSGNSRRAQLMPMIEYRRNVILEARGIYERRRAPEAISFEDNIRGDHRGEDIEDSNGNNWHQVFDRHSTWDAIRIISELPVTANEAGSFESENEWIPDGL